MSDKVPVSFLMGTKESMPDEINEGTVYVTTDEKSLYIDISADERVQINEEKPEVVVSDTAPTDENVKVWINPNEDNYDGGSAEPDLVIGLNLSNTKVTPDNSSAPVRYLPYMTVDDVTIVSGSVSATAEKIKQGLPVRVLLNDVHFYWSTSWFRCIGEASHVLLASADAEYPNEGNLSLIAAFFLSNVGNCATYPVYVRIMFDVTTGVPTWYSCVQLSFVD